LLLGNSRDNRKETRGGERKNSGNERGERYYDSLKEFLSKKGGPLTERGEGEKEESLILEEKKRINRVSKGDLGFFTTGKGIRKKRGEGAERHPVNEGRGTSQR